VDLLGSSIPRFMANGHPHSLLACWSTCTLPSLTLSSSSPPTPSYFLPWPLACSVWASTNAVPLVWAASCGDRWAIGCSLAVVFSDHGYAALHSQGSHLALGCHHRRNRARGKWLVSRARPFHSSLVYVAGVHLFEPKR